MKMLEDLAVRDWAVLVAAAAGSVGEGEGPEWSERVSARALELARTAAYLAQAGPYIGRQRFVGRVVRVEDPATSLAEDRAGEVLEGLARVVIKASVGRHPDQLWVDRRSEAGQRLIAAAKALQGREVAFVRESQVRRQGEGLVMDGDKVRTFPYLIEIAPAEKDRAAAGAPAAEASAPAAVDGPATAGAPGKPARPLVPASPKELLVAARELYGVGREEVAALATELCGPPAAAGRTAEEIAAIWAELVRRQGRSKAA